MKEYTECNFFEQAIRRVEAGNIGPEAPNWFREEFIPGEGHCSMKNGDFYYACDKHNCMLLQMYNKIFEEITVRFVDGKNK